MNHLVLYSYYETPLSKRNLQFFLKYGVFTDPDVKYLFIINGNQCSVVLPTSNNIMVINRPNIGHDFGAWSDALHRINISFFQKFIFLNDTVCGPFIPRYVPNNIRWYTMFTNLLSDNVKLCGLTINYYPHHPRPNACTLQLENCPGCRNMEHVQSMMFCTDRTGLDVLLQTVLGRNLNYEGDYKKGRVDYIYKYEIGASRAIINAGYSLAAHYVCDINKKKTIDIWQNGQYFNSNINPYETMFIKNNRFNTPLHQMYYETLM